MSQRRVHTAGYSGRRPEWLLTAVLRLNAVVLDIRLSPHSRIPSWSKGHLAAFLGVDEDGIPRYRHLPAFGNVNYRTGGPIVLADPDAGIDIVRNESRTPILMCGCANFDRCHRRVVARLLQEHLDVVAEELRDAF
jgi:uncharacterized protein (DUF488 family)